VGPGAELLLGHLGHAHVVADESRGGLEDHGVGGRQRVLERFPAHAQRVGVQGNRLDARKLPRLARRHGEPEREGNVGHVLKTDLVAKRVEGLVDPGRVHEEDRSLLHPAPLPPGTGEKRAKGS
jgi:hypothetical protein